MRRDSAIRSAVLQQLRQADRGTGFARPTPSRPSAGTRSPACAVLAGIFSFQYRRRDRSLHRGEYHLCARARVWRPRGCRSVLAAIAPRDRHSSAGKSRVRIHRRMGSPAARELGKDPGVGLRIYLAVHEYPVRNALGIYTMWVLLSSDSEREYEALVAARAA